MKYKAPKKEELALNLIQPGLRSFSENTRNVATSKRYTFKHKSFRTHKCFVKKA